LNLPLEYNILEPKNPSENPPLLLMLHGYGSDEHDLFSFADELNQKFLVVSLKAPISLGFGGNAWYDIAYTENAEKWTNVPQALKSRSLVMECLDIIHKEKNTNPNETYLLGFSQGAILGYSLSINFPQRFKGVLALSGYVDKQLLPKTLEADKYPDYFVSHGKQDGVIPIAWAQKSAEYLKENQFNFEYNEYNMEHGINPQCFADFMGWLKNRNMI